MTRIQRPLLGQYWHLEVMAASLNQGLLVHPSKTSASHAAESFDEYADKLIFNLLCSEND